MIYVPTEVGRELGWFTDQENEPHREDDLCLFSSVGPSFELLSITRSRQDSILAAFPENCRPIVYVVGECILDIVSG